MQSTGGGVGLVVDDEVLPGVGGGVGVGLGGVGVGLGGGDVGHVSLTGICEPSEQV